VRVIAPDDGWHTDWYHDGELTGRLVSQGDWDRLTTVEPVFLAGGALLALCRIESDVDADKAYPPPNAAAYWTEGGLTQITPVPERIAATCWGNRIVVFETDEYIRIRFDGIDTMVSPKPEEYVSWSSLVPLADGVFLVKYRDETAGTQLMCLDHGNIRYRIAIPSHRILPDGQGGFFSPEWDIAEWTLARDLSPVRMHHYNADGQYDRVFRLYSSQGILTPLLTVPDPETGTLVLYGSVADNTGLRGVFMMTLDSGMNVMSVRVRNIDPDYRKCEAEHDLIAVSADGCPWVYLHNPDNPDTPGAAAVPFAALEESDDWGIVLE
ncbi:MAG: hypothetical protein J6U26_00470, partial [Lachnospiraceae bacterium]|nr:hypothetical protein [Lachnospiraceae bacterium]